MYENAECMTGTVYAVVVTYNRVELLKECINALLQQTYENLVISVIDNASTDGTEALIAEYVDGNKVQYYNTGSNLGGAGGFNYGMKIAACDKNCEYIWIMDDDTIPEPDALENLMLAGGALNNKYGFLSSYVKWTDGNCCLMNRQDAAVKDWITDYEYLKCGFLRISRATFVSLLFKKSVVIEEGLPIKEFFIWGDDTEYTLRISDKHRCYFVSDSVVVHKMKANMNTTLDIFINEDSDRLERYFYRERNMFYIRRKQGKKELSKYLASFIGMSITLLAKCHTKKFKKLKIIWKGLLSGIVFKPSIEYVEIENSERNLLR